MREFYFTFDKGLKVGLRRRKHNPRNLQALVECLNAKPGEFRLEPYAPFTLPVYTLAGVPVDLSLEWPFPQLIGGASYGFLVLRDTFNAEDLIYTISDIGVLTQIAVCDVLTYGVYGDQFDAADFGPYVLMTNGLMMVYYDTLLTTWLVTTGLANVPLMKTVCNFKGQAVGGNIQSAWHGCGQNSLVWSNIGEMNFTPTSRNEAGFREHSGSGEVLRVKRLGDFVMVYGSESIAVLQPVSVPAATFKFEELLNVGIPSKEAIAGDENEHAFVDSKGYLWRVGRQLAVEKLGIASSFPSLERQGYKEFLSPLSNVVVSYRPDEQEFYIGDGSTCYVLTSWGLGECHQLLTSIERINNELTGVFGDSGDTEYRVETDTIDLGYRGLKTLQVLEHGLRSPAAARAGANWRNDGGAFMDAGVGPVNNQGIATRPVSGAEFRLKFEADSYTDVELDYITARYKMTDMRSIRGIYAPAPRGQDAD